MSTFKAKQSTAYLLLSFMVLVWGFNFSLVKWTFSEISPLAFNLIRFSIASALILTIFTAKEGWKTMPAVDVMKMVGLGLIGHALYQIFFIRGLSLTTAGNSSLLVATSPIWTAIFAAGLKKDEVNRLAWVGILFAFLGVFLVTVGGSGKITFAGSKSTGDLLTLAAAVSLSIYTVLSRDLLERYSPLKLTTITMVVGSIGLWVYGGRHVIQQDWTALSVASWGVMVYSAVFAVVVGYVIWFTAVNSVGPTRTAIFNNMTPIVSFTVAFLLLGEPVAPLQIAGGVTVLFGIFLAVKS